MHENFKFTHTFHYFPSFLSDIQTFHDSIDTNILTFVKLRKVLNFESTKKVASNVNETTYEIQKFQNGSTKKKKLFREFLMLSLFSQAEVHLVE